MIVIFNFNYYLGGGETLLVRWANYMKINNVDCRLFFRKGSYIEKDLIKNGIQEEKLCPIESDVDYYYLNSAKRTKLLDEIHSYIKEIPSVQLVSFCARELYTIIDYCKMNKNATLAHMIFHNQDNLYLCQSIFDKVKTRFGIDRCFSRKKMIDFNTYIFNRVSNQSVVISQSKLQAALLKHRFGIYIKPNHVVALPVCDFSKIVKIKGKKDHTILWIGRICDTKIPSLCAMMRVVNKLNGYHLTIVGDGDMDVLERFIKENEIDKNKLSFVGEVTYSELGNIIKKHSIGYAIGTSIMEVGKYGLPVIMALYAPDCKQFDSNICGGLYSDVSLGNIGDTLFFPEFGEKIYQIEDVLDYIDKNYERASDECYEYIRDTCDLNMNIERYISIINQSKVVDTSDIVIPSASCLRKVLFKFFS